MKPKILIGTAGSPGSSTLEGIQIIKQKHLHALEVEFVHGIHMSNSLAEQIGQQARKLNISLSVHAPYHINLNSKEKSIIQASKKRILTSCERAHYLKANYVVFHPGYYSSFTPEQTFQNIKQEILEIQDIIKEQNYKVKLAPETTGKINVFGSLDEILELQKQTNCYFCIDFAHLKARLQKDFNYNEIFSKIKPFNHLHSHFSGIEYSSKGERRHILTPLTEIKELAKEILKRKINITIINESPNPLLDSLKTKKIFEDLGYKF